MPSWELLRRRIEVQGYTGLGDETLRELDPWLRFTPFLVGLIAALGTIAKSPFLMFALSTISILGAILRGHPFDHLYHRFVRPFENSPRLPPSPGRRKCVYGLHAFLAALVAWGFLKGHAQLAYALGWTMAAEAGWLAAHQISLVSEAWARVSETRGRA